MILAAMRLVGRLRSRRGQVATEYMLAIAVLVIAMLVAGYAFYDPLKDGVNQFGNKFTTYYAEPGGPQ